MTSSRSGPLVVLAGLAQLTACYPTVTAGLDAAATVHGPLASLVSAHRDARNYAFGVGGGARDFTLELGVQPLATAAPSVMPAARPADAATTPRYLATTSSLDMRWTPMRFHVLSINLHAGPALGVLADRTSGTVHFAQGFRTGAGIELSFNRVSAFVDVYRGGLVFADGPATGTSQLVGVTIGVGVR